MSLSASPVIFDPIRTRANYARAEQRQSGPDAARYLLDHARDELAERLAFMNFVADRSLMIADLGGIVAAALADRSATVDRLTPSSHDLEQPIGTELYDLIVDCGSLATINDVPAALMHWREALKPGGLFIAFLIGAGSLPVIRSAMLASDPDRPAPRVHPQIDSPTASALLARAGYRRYVVDRSDLQVGYRSLGRLVADLRDQGLGNALALNAPPLTREAVGRAEAALADYAVAGRTVETFELITMTGWKG